MPTWRVIGSCKSTADKNNQTNLCDLNGAEHPKFYQLKNEFLPSTMLVIQWYNKLFYISFYCILRDLGCDA